MTKIFREIIGIAEACGVTAPHIVYRGRHARLLGRIGADVLSLPIPGTPSCWRALANLRADLRRRTRERRAPR